jgi:hypothetical protein
MVTARMAQTLLDAATPGPWLMDLYRERDAIHIDAPRGDGRIGHDSWEGLAIVYGCEDNWIPGERAAHGNASLICAAHDLARTVVELHAEVERAASAERARIVALLAEMAEATRGLDGRETVASFAYRSAILGVLELTP